MLEEAQTQFNILYGAKARRVKKITNVDEGESELNKNSTSLVDPTTGGGSPIQTTGGGSPIQKDLYNQPIVPRNALAGVGVSMRKIRGSEETCPLQVLRVVMLKALMALESAKKVVNLTLTYLFFNLTTT